MILQAKRADNGDLVGEATCLGKLATACAQSAIGGALPRLMVFDTVDCERWYNEEKARALAVVLLRDHDVLTQPISARIIEHAQYWRRTPPPLNRLEFAKKLGWAFGLKGLGENAVETGWRAYLEAEKP